LTRPDSADRPQDELLSLLASRLLNQAEAVDAPTFVSRNHTTRAVFMADAEGQPHSLQVLVDQPDDWRTENLLTEATMYGEDGVTALEGLRRAIHLLDMQVSTLESGLGQPNKTHQRLLRDLGDIYHEAMLRTDSEGRSFVRLGAAVDRIQGAAVVNGALVKVQITMDNRVSALIPYSLRLDFGQTPPGERPKLSDRLYAMVGLGGVKLFGYPERELEVASQTFLNFLRLLIDRTELIPWTDD
jgi:hypothetical protein